MADRSLVSPVIAISSPSFIIKQVGLAEDVPRSVSAPFVLDRKKHDHSIVRLPIVAGFYGNRPAR
jgi:hypothetical protein